MDLCPNCLHEVSKKDKRCPVCKQKLIKKRSKNSKKFLVSLLSILILIGGVAIFYKNAHSKERIMNKFEAALANHNTSALEKLVVHKDSSKITKAEAAALSRLVTAVGEVKTAAYFKAIEQNNLLHTYKMVAPEVSIEKSVNPDLTYEIKGVSSKNVIPGLYEIEGVFLPKDFPTTSIAKQLVVAQDTQVDEELFNSSPISFRNIDLGLISNVSLQHGENSVPLLTLIEKSPFSIPNRYKAEFQLVADLPWGKTTSKKLFIDEVISSFSVNLVNEETESKINKLGEQLHLALSKKKFDESVFSPNALKVVKNSKKMGGEFSPHQLSPATVAVDDENNITGLIAWYIPKTAVNYSINFKYDAASKQFMIEDFGDLHSILDQWGDSVTPKMSKLPENILSAYLKANFNTLLDNSEYVKKNVVRLNATTLIMGQVPNIEVKKFNRIEDDLIDVSLIQYFGERKLHFDAVFSTNGDQYWRITKMTTLTEKNN